MNALRLEPAHVALSLDLPPATLAEARDRRDALARLRRGTSDWRALHCEARASASS